MTQHMDGRFCRHRNNNQVFGRFVSLDCAFSYPTFPYIRYNEEGKAFYCHISISVFPTAPQAATTTVPPPPIPLLIIQPYRHFTYVTAHSPTLPSLYLRHSSFSNSSIASPTSRFILQPFFRFSYVTNSPLNSPGEPPMLLSTPVVAKSSNQLHKITAF